MSALKKLASQTAIYGLSSIVGRFLNYLLVPIYTRFFLPEEYGVVSEFYAYSGFLSVLLTFGMETGFFRFAKDERFTKVYSTILQFLIASSLFFVALIAFFSTPLADSLQYKGFEHYFIWFAIIIACDAIGALPFAKLRQEENAVRFAVVKLLEIGVNVGLNFVFIYLLQKSKTENISWFNPSLGVGYIFIANLVASAIKLLLLSDKLIAVKNGFDAAFIKTALRYSLPMVIIGFAGIINEMLDRMSMKFLLPGTIKENLAQLGIYAACYKVSIVMSLFIQAFRFAAEPFFFSHAKEKNSRQLYADVMNWFMLFCSCIFVLVTIYLDWFGLFVGANYREGLFIVPILLLANMFLGAYVNLSIWYKLSDKTALGALVSIVGSLVTITLLYWWIPQFGYEGAAWATLACYAFMAIASYLLGQKFFPVPYNLWRLFFFLAVCVAVWLVAICVNYSTSDMKNAYQFALFAFAIFVLLFSERKNLKKITNRL
ncbi:MAG TPA: oligosaccharide flippase family protein [Chitinophagales bacterium]